MYKIYIIYITLCVQTHTRILWWSKCGRIAVGFYFYFPPYLYFPFFFYNKLILLFQIDEGKLVWKLTSENILALTVFYSGNSVHYNFKAIGRLVLKASLPLWPTRLAELGDAWTWHELWCWGLQRLHQHSLRGLLGLVCCRTYAYQQTLFSETIHLLRKHDFLGDTRRCNTIQGLYWGKESKWLQQQESRLMLHHESSHQKKGGVLSCTLECDHIVHSLGPQDTGKDLSALSCFWDPANGAGSQWLWHSDGFSC